MDNYDNMIRHVNIAKYYLNCIREIDRNSMTFQEFNMEFGQLSNLYYIHMSCAIGFASK